MSNFLEDVLVDLKNKNLKLDELIYIVPSKRAGLFLKQLLSKSIVKPVFAPQILSIQEFVANISDLKELTNLDILFELYSAYKNQAKTKDTESFESFIKWAQILLQDFNEIDRYLIKQNEIFDYLNNITDIKHWSLNSTQTELTKKYSEFWKIAKTYYYTFTETLLNSKKGYQGLIYREAVANLESYMQCNKGSKHIFLGFNALNTAESQIIQELLKNELAYIYWDIDTSFIDNKIHNAGLFTRQYKRQWPYYKNHTFNWMSSSYRERKTIEIIGLPKPVGQAKYIGNLLDQINIDNKDLSDVAVILGEENLLLPALNSIPNTVSKINVTMGLPLNLIPLASLFELLFRIHKNNTKQYYYKDITKLLTHPQINILFETQNENIAKRIINYINGNNIVFLSKEELYKISKQKIELIKLLLGSWENNAEKAIKNCIEIIYKIKVQLDENRSNSNLELEYLHRFNTLFNKLSALETSYNYLNNINTLHHIYKELLSSETLDFKGEPFEGLQIMGMLESRVLDFETVIISGVNEGILPAGKTQNSFIPFDVKIENGLPTYREKDAVYTYHFYRLLQRAKKVYILYNTEVDAIKGGEKSRFITQLEVEGIHNIKHSIATAEMPTITNKLQTIHKTDLVISKLKAIASRGFSPSSLTNYIRNPIDFYYEKVLGVREFENVEEQIAANTLGSVIHNTLEDFYKPLTGDFLSIEALTRMKKLIPETVKFHFKELYHKGNFAKGKNLIAFEIAQNYIANFLDQEIENIKTGNEIKILAVEVEKTIDLHIEGLDYSVKLIGKIDRIDSFNGTTRIIDYKSGKVEQNKVEIADWQDLTSDYDKYSKSFQILCYAYIMAKEQNINLPIEAGIISFKNLNAGLLKFGKKEASKSRNKDQLISQDTLINFEIELKKLITEICNPNINFTEKEIP